jgi:hypothetical protein
MVNLLFIGTQIQIYSLFLCEILGPSLFECHDSYFAQPTIEVTPQTTIPHLSRNFAFNMASYRVTASPSSSISINQQSVSTQSPVPALIGSLTIYSSDRNLELIRRMVNILHTEIQHLQTQLSRSGVDVLMQAHNYHEPGNTHLKNIGKDSGDKRVGGIRNIKEQITWLKDKRTRLDYMLQFSQRPDKFRIEMPKVADYLKKSYGVN